MGRISRRNLLRHLLHVIITSRSGIATGETILTPPPIFILSNLQTLHLLLQLSLNLDRVRIRIRSNDAIRNGDSTANLILRLRRDWLRRGIVELDGREGRRESGRSNGLVETEEVIDIGRSNGRGFDGVRLRRNWSRVKSINEAITIRGEGGIRVRGKREEKESHPNRFGVRAIETVVLVHHVFQVVVVGDGD
ncbi:hypothetical protein V8G54_003520 [Vigna mungo]|uniref:Uncharacterized protein n=1 Tax=Vigna mungo TaxID=3915 RepID=A0AAQ3SDX9_VIGMU